MPGHPPHVSFRGDASMRGGKKGRRKKEVDWKNQWAFGYFGDDEGIFFYFWAIFSGIQGCAQGSRDRIGCQGLNNTGILHAKQAPYPMYFLSDPGYSNFVC